MEDNRALYMIQLGIREVAPRNAGGGFGDVNRRFRNFRRRHQIARCENTRFYSCEVKNATE
eukprot:5284090-Prymnesium_polylepis.1